MKRRIFIILAVTFAALSILWAVLTPLSFYRNLYLIRTNRQSNALVSIGDGYLAFRYQWGPGMVAFIQFVGSAPNSWVCGFDATPSHRLSWDVALRPRYLNFPSIPGPTGAIHRRGLVIPTWILSFACIVPIGVRSIWRRWHAIAPGCCPHCGYDLRATPDRCPECGQVRSD